MKQQKATDTKALLVETGGSSIIKYKPLFSKDARYLLCPCGNVIKVYALATGYAYQRLVGHEKKVTGLQHHPKNTLQVLSSSTDGCVKLWDYEDGVLLSTFKFGAPLCGLYTHGKSSTNFYVAMKQDNKINLHKFSLPTETNKKEVTENEIVARNLPSKLDQLVAFSQDFFVICFEHKVNVYQELREGKVKRARHFVNDKESPVTCVTCHPYQAAFTTGHSTGEIKIWHKIFDAANVVVNIQHWHSVEVLALSYTPRGSTILSGGHECVLVQWQEDGKHFLPRLGAPIEKIAVSDDNVLYACCHADNSITIVTSYFTIRQTIDGFAASGSDLPCGLKYDDVTGACVTNGRPGHLLFYEPRTDAQLYNLDIVSHNYISSADLQRPLSRIRITQVASSHKASKGHVMATVEFDRERKREQKLKFWHFSETEQQWMLNTVVKSPHNEEEVTSLRFRPFDNYCVTTGNDGCCKVWKMDEKSWFCDSAVTYREMACRCSAVSEDGSALALAFGRSVVLCGCDDVADLDLLTSHSQDITQLEFGRGQCSHFLIIATRSSIESWNMLMGALHWVVDLSIGMLVADQSSSNMVAFTSSNEIFIFTPDQALPIFSAKLNIKPLTACFIPCKDGKFEWSLTSELYIVSDQMTVHKFWPEDLRDEIHRVTQTTPSVTSQLPGLPLLSKKDEDVDETTKGSIEQTAMQEALSMILATPSHVLPSVTKLCGPFISKLLLGVEKGGAEEGDQSQKSSSEKPPDILELMEVTEPPQPPPEKDPEPGGFDYLAPTFVSLYSS